MLIEDFKTDDKKGSLSYKFNFSTTGNWESEVKDYEYNFTVIIEYDPGDFKTKKEHEEEIVSKILPKDLKAVDEITPATDTTKKDIAPNKPENLETKLANFVNAKPNASGWTAKVDNYEKSPKGSLSYDVTFKKNGFQDKKVSILYPDNSFLTETEIMDDLAKKAKAADGITADSTKPIPNKSTDLETKLANFIIKHYGLDGLPNINLESEVTNYQKDESEGSLSYDVIFKRKPGSMTIDGKAINLCLKN